MNDDYDRQYAIAVVSEELSRAWGLLSQEKRAFALAPAQDAPPPHAEFSFMIPMTLKSDVSTFTVGVLIERVALHAPSVLTCYYKGGCMPQVFQTRQFKAGNSAAVRIPMSMAFPHQTELTVTRDGNRIIVEPCEKTLEEVPDLFAALKPHFNGEMPEFEMQERDW